MIDLEEFEKKLPHPPAPVANYVSAVSTNSLVFTSGILPFVGEELQHKGKLGKDLTVEQGQEAAYLCLLNALSILKKELGSLKKIQRIVKMVVYVQSCEAFIQHPRIANGASEALIEIFGERGRHARAAVGVNSLPLNAAVEIELICEF